MKDQIEKAIDMGVSETLQQASPEDQLLVDRLNELTGANLTLQDFDDWLEGGLAYAKFDAIVYELLGEELLNELEIVARVVAGLAYALGIGRRMSGGVDLKKVGVKKLV